MGDAEFDTGLRTRACSSCHARKIRCDLSARRPPPCTRCEQAGVSCQRVPRRRRPIRALNSIMSVSSPAVNTESRIATVSTLQVSEDNNAKEPFNSLGQGDDEPQSFEITTLCDNSNEDSILLDFLSQDFNGAAIGDYQVTFVDSYACITRLLGQEFGRGFEPDVCHFRDAPFVKRTHGSIPRTVSSHERSLLEANGSFTLPSPPVADAFIVAFFDRVYPTMPIVDREEFMRNYYSATPTSLKLPILLLQSIILSGSTVIEHPALTHPAHEVSARLHFRAKALIDSRFEQDRLTLVQAHLLFSTFTSDSCDDTVHNMWLSLGSAIRIAQGLGMHKELGKAKATPSMRRHWRRIWWSLFIHDTLCSFEWGRPRAIHLGDSDVAEITEEDFKSDEPGGLSTMENVQFFIQQCKLCLVIVDWMELLSPGGVRRYSKDSSRRAQKLQYCRVELDRWLQDLPPILQAPRDFKGFSLWSATLHISYYAAVLRFSSVLPHSAVHMREAAMSISWICEDLERQDLLGSIWTFAVHQFDLAMSLHARFANGSNAVDAKEGLDLLRKGLPWLEKVAKRNSVARQGTVFYRACIQRGLMRPDFTSRPDDELEQVVSGESGINVLSDDYEVAGQGTTPWNLFYDGSLAMPLESLNCDSGLWDWQNMN